MNLKIHIIEKMLIREPLILLMHFLIKHRSVCFEQSIGEIFLKCQHSSSTDDLPLELK